MSVYSEIPEIVQHLLQKEAYPYPVSLPIRLEQTHISYLLLTGKWANKLKNPLNLGFLNFSSLEKRKFYCEEELKLNRHFAPELYRAVLPITKSSSGKYRLGQKGDQAFLNTLCKCRNSRRVLFSEQCLKQKHLNFNTCRTWDTDLPAGIWMRQQIQ